MKNDKIIKFRMNQLLLLLANMFMSSMLFLVKYHVHVSVVTSESQIPIRNFWTIPFVTIDLTNVAIAAETVKIPPALVLCHNSGCRTC